MTQALIQECLDAIHASPHEAGIRSCIPPKSNRKAKIRWNRRMYRERNRIERMICHLKINRAIATRYDKLARRSGPTWPGQGRGPRKPGNAAACFTQFAICASSSSSPSWMSM